MKNNTLRVFLSAFTIFSIVLVTSVSINAAPVRFSQVVQVVNVKPGKANTGGFTQLHLVNDNSLTTTGDGDDETKKTATPPQTQEKRVIVETRSDIIEDDSCESCPPIPPPGGFPKWPLLGLAFIPFLFLIKRHTPTPTPTLTPTITPTICDICTPTQFCVNCTPTLTPTITPTPPCDICTPTQTCVNCTPTMTPTPVPEPVTILLFGTGLAGFGIAARRRFRKKDEDETEEQD
jgi:hypothetical protein